MTIKEDIINYIGCNEVDLKMIYNNFRNTKKESIRSILNQECKKGKLIIRTGKGIYKLKKQDI